CQTSYCKSGANSLKYSLLLLSNFQKKGGETMKMSLTEMGQGMVEYAFIIMLVAIVIIAAVTLLGPTVGKLFSSVNASL
ncbi:MAG: hypothetical protein WA821_00950, partial [Anaerolineales bacterium]